MTFLLKAKILENSLWSPDILTYHVILLVYAKYILLQEHVFFFK